MLLWFAGLSFVLAVVVFRDPALDHRLVMVGALVPDVVDPVFGGARHLHTVAFSVALLAAVMLATKGRRRRRRQLLAVPIGTLLHLLLDGTWTNAQTFWWPFLGARLSGPLPSLDRPLLVVLLMEVAGAAALAWAWGRFGLTDRRRRRVFLHTGRLDRSLIG